MPFLKLLHKYTQLSKKPKIYKKQNFRGVIKISAIIGKPALGIFILKKDQIITNLIQYNC